MSAPPALALVGRPNVGKSTLFNRLAGAGLALVFGEPGVTRDRLAREVTRPFGRWRLWDTPGLGGAEAPVLARALAQATHRAIAEADLALLVVDVRVGRTPADLEVAARLRRQGRPFLVVANRADTPALDAGAHDFWDLGGDAALPVSAEHGRGIDALWEAIVAALPGAPAEPEAPAGAPTAPPAPPPRVVLLGRPNVGKSSLVNRLAGGHLVASPVAGTTRDPVVAIGDAAGDPLAWVDTCGVRRRRDVHLALEQKSVARSLAELTSADVALVVCDVTEAIADQDARLVAAAHAAGCALVWVGNKGDLLAGPGEEEAWRASCLRALPAFAWVPRLVVSAEDGRGLEALTEAVRAVHQARRRRIGTGELNRWVADATRAQPPPSERGRRAQIYYVSQPFVAPPTFVFSARAPERIPQAYARYLEAGLRRAYGFEGVPLWLKFRPRGRQARAARQRP